MIRPTSIEAHEAIKPHKRTQRDKVLEAIVRTGGATDEEIVALTGLSPSSVRPRRGELFSAGLIREASITRKSNSGRSCVVWEVVT